MTGFGEARTQDPDAGLTISAEIRAVNNRNLKITTRINDPYGRLEPELERLIRDRVRRGTVQVYVRVERPRKPEDYRLDATALEGYRARIAELGGAVDFAALLTLPGVVAELATAAPDLERDWPAVAKVAAEALGAFEADRAREGAAMAAELAALGRSIRGTVDLIAARVPLLVEEFRKRITERVQALVREHDVTVEPKDLIREVAILADRGDVSEELVRLRAHLDQYDEIVNAPESSGRKLEFVVQEMGRETNTVGSKSLDVEVSRRVVDVKGALERIRELVQNVE